MFKKRPTLPTLPIRPDVHPNWLEHEQQLDRLQARMSSTQREIAEIETQQAAAKSALAGHQVDVLLGDVDGHERAAAAKTVVAEMEARLADARDRLAIEQEAVRRLEHRGAELRASITRAVRAEADAAHLDLVGRVAHHLSEMQPALLALQQLRMMHGIGTSSGLPSFDDLIVTAPESKGRRFMETARQLGADIAA